MDIRLTQRDDWALLKQTRLAALQDMPTAFAVTYQTAVGYSDQQWQERAAGMGTQFWLALEGARPVGMIGAGFNGAGRYELIGMWVAPDARGSAAAAGLVAAVKARAAERGVAAVFLEVAPDNGRAVSFYRRQGFGFLDEWEPLDSHPHILLQTMCWRCD